MEERVPNGTLIWCEHLEKLFIIHDAIETNNQFGYGVYLYLMVETMGTGFGLYRKEFRIID